MNRQVTQHWNQWSLLPLLYIIALPLFYRLGLLPIYSWDEALFALRALYWADEGGFLVNFNQFDVVADHKNLKPPLLSIIQGISLKLFGLSAWSLRIPIALIIFLGLSIITIRSNRYFDDPLLGFLSSIILITTPGFVGHHVARTGDHDGVLAIVGLFIVLLLYRYHKTENDNLLYRLSALFVIAFWIKLTMVLLLIPGLLLFLLFEARLIPLLRKKAFWISLGIFILGICVYLLWMQWVSPGSLTENAKQNLYGRYFSTVDGHDFDWTYYWKRWIAGRFGFWLYILPFGIMSIFLFRLKRLALLLIMVIIPFFAIISTSETKLQWYDAPLLPLVALFTAIFLMGLIKKIPGKFGKDPWLKLGLILLIGLWPYLEIIKDIQHETHLTKEEKVFHLLEKRSQHSDQSTFYLALTNEFGANYAFYAEKFKRELDMPIKMKRSEEYQIGDELIYCTHTTKKVLSTFYSLEELDAYEDCKYVRLGAKK